MSSSMLIIDDSATMRKIVRISVRKAGLNIEEVREANNGKEALEIIKEASVDIILCDINMPEMNGLEFVKHARQLPECANAKIVMLSTESSSKIIEQVKSDGADGYITKPFTPDKLEEVLSQIMQKC